MKRIASAEEKEKASKRKKIVASIVMLAVLVISTLGYAFFSGDSGSNGGTNQTAEGEGFQAKIGDDVFYFTNAPALTKNISINITNGLRDYYQKPLFIVSESDSISQEIATNIGRYAERVQLACYGACKEDLPEKNCTENLIVFNASEKGIVYQEDNCVFIDGDMKAVDAFLYKVIGIN